MRAFFDKYAPIITAAVLSAYLLAAIAGVKVTRDAFCQTDENCLREWISALSGWAAVAAAFFTLRAMHEQRKEANRYQRENVELEIMGRLSIVRNVQYYGSMGYGHIHSAQMSLQTMVQMPDPSNPPGAGLAQYLHNMLKPVDFAQIREADGLVGFPPSVNLDRLANAIDRIPGALSDIDEAINRQDENAFTAARQTAISVCCSAKSDFNMISVLTNAFIEKWQSRVT